MIEMKGNLKHWDWPHIEYLEVFAKPTDNALQVMPVNVGGLVGHR